MGPLLQQLLARMAVQQEQQAVNGLIPMYPNADGSYGAPQVSGLPVPVQHPALVRYAVSGEDDLVPSEWEDEDDDLIGFDGDQEFEDIIRDSVNGPGRWFRRKNKFSNRISKKQGRLSRVRNPNGMRARFLNKRINKLETKRNREQAKIDTLRQGAGMSPQTTGMVYAAVGAPMGAGRLVHIPFQPQDIGSKTDWDGSSSEPSVVATVPVGGVTEELELKTPQVPYAEYKVVGIAFNLDLLDGGASVLGRNLVVSGGSDIFPVAGQWQDMSLYAIRDNDRLLGLRDYPVLNKNNDTSVTAKVRGDSGDRARFSLSLVVDIMQDPQTTQGPSQARLLPPTPWG